MLFTANVIIWGTEQSFSGIIELACWPVPLFMTHAEIYLGVSTYSELHLLELNIYGFFFFFFLLGYINNRASY